MKIIFYLPREKPANRKYLKFTIMNRFLLILVIIVTSSCELPSIIKADQYIEPIPLEASKDIPVYENIWDQIKDTSLSEQANLDEKTLQY